MSDPSVPVERALRDIVAPMVAADGGEVYLVRSASTAVVVRIHLAGACAGCPGVRLTSSDVIEPILRAAGAQIVEITSGWIIPEGAERIEVERSTGRDGGEAQSPPDIGAAARTEE